MDDEYPTELIFPHKDVPGVIRLSTASVLLAEANEIDGLPSVETEYLLLAELRAHALCNAPLKGNVLRRSEAFLKAMCASIQQNELQPISVRRSLDGAVDPTRTWILVDDFSDWCEVRTLQLSDWFNMYVDDETKIFSAAGQAADEARRELENPEREKRTRERAKFLSGDNNENFEGVLALVRENERLQVIAHSKAGLAEKPLAIRERATLLNVIAALLQYVGDKEAAIINAILEAHPGAPGLKERTLQKAFAEAKRSLRSL